MGALSEVGTVMMVCGMLQFPYASILIAFNNCANRIDGSLYGVSSKPSRYRQSANDGTANQL